IQYDFDFPGAQARITVFDAQGHKIKEIVPGALLTPGPGTYFWDGTNQKNQKADVGMYVILFEVVNQNSGEIKRFRLVGVLGADF
ncbi:MAG: hypothetical protein KDD99_16280, partial [Bacteroidetes bacterium]|nr:hypothetical protein [Bacteroidota bacterium]